MAGQADMRTELSEPLIRTPDQRVRVFISSTLGELAPERVAVSDVIRRLRLAPVMFELGARPHPPRALYRAYLEQSHIFVGIYWERYGWVAEDMDISGLEDEYRECRPDMPRLLYVKEPSPAREPRLQSLVDEMNAGLVRPRVFSTPQELADLVANDLALLLSARFSPGRGGPAPEADTPEPELAQTAPGRRLPLPPTPLVGRVGEIEVVTDLVLRDDVRLVTLSGPGGIGKSRIALEVASGVEQHFSGGVFFVRMSTIDDPELAEATIAAAVGTQTEGTRPLLERLIEDLDGEPRLLVLDNFEHLLPAASVVSTLLRECPQLKILVTSRAVLRLHGEWDHPVPPLAPLSAMQLFVSRAGDVRPDFRVGPAEVDAVTQIVERLDGLPLAIELAAARARLLPPNALLRRLGRRLDLLTGGAADLPERQRTLRATIDWSYDLLASSERLLLARLSVFSGGWTLEAAETVCAGDGVDDVLGGLSALLEQSLIGVADTTVDGPRFRMLETIHDYARERLADLEPGDRTRHRHANWLTELAAAAEPHLRDVGAPAWSARLDEEMDNFRGAVRWLLATKRWVEAVEMIWSVSIHLWIGDHLVEGRRWLNEAADGFDALDERGRTRLEFLLGVMAYEHGDYTETVDRLERAAAGFESLGDCPELGSALAMLGAAKPHFDDFDGATADITEAVRILRQTDDRWRLAFALTHLAALVARRGDLDACAVHAAEALDIARQIGSTPLAAQALMELGYLRLVRRDTGRARALIEESVRIFRSLRFREGMAYCVDGMAAIALAEGNVELAATALGGAAALRDSVSAKIWPALRDEHDMVVRLTRAGLGDAAFEAAFQAGRSLSRTELLSRILEQPAGSGESMEMAVDVRAGGPPPAAPAPTPIG